MRTVGIDDDEGEHLELFVSVFTTTGAQLAKFVKKEAENANKSFATVTSNFNVREV